VIAKDARERRLRMEGLRAQLAAMRTASTECVANLSREQADFRAYDLGVDSLRSAIDEDESGPSGGVPGDRYDAYLAVFDRYNRSVAEWQEQADSLELRGQECAELVQAHNLLADSVLGLVEARAAERNGAPPPHIT
jgi:hypothetical protein